jgi:mitochondrial Rho GTPase 1
MKDNIRILVVGDDGVGKSSLISAFISQHFPAEVPPVLTDSVIPAESTSNNVCVTIVDSSSKPNDRDVLRQKIITSDSIVALYDVTRPESFESLSNFWLPFIKDLCGDEYKPIILAGTKTDLLMEEQDAVLLNNILLAFPFVMNCCNCSAVNIQNIEHVFYLAGLFVNFPLSFILDVTEEEFTPTARNAFLRIFRIFDQDGDNLLNDSELSDTQMRCFDDFINADELLALKRQISIEVVGGVVNNCVTFDGFVGLIKMNLIANQYQIPWVILRSFNYDDNLNIVVRDS